MLRTNHIRSGFAQQIYRYRPDKKRKAAKNDSFTTTNPKFERMNRIKHFKTSCFYYLVLLLFTVKMQQLHKGCVQREEKNYFFSKKRQ